MFGFFVLLFFILIFEYSSLTLWERCSSGVIGSHVALKMLWTENVRAGSIPASSTKKIDTSECFSYLSDIYYYETNR